MQSEERPLGTRIQETRNTEGSVLEAEQFLGWCLRSSLEDVRKGGIRAEAQRQECVPLPAWDMLVVGLSLS